MRFRACFLLVISWFTPACGRVEPTASGFSADEVPAPEPLDPGINPEDTWVVFDAAITTVDSIELAQPIVDPETGQQTSQLVLRSGPNTLYSVEAGYDLDGILRVRMTGQWSAGDPAVDEIDRVDEATDLWIKFVFDRPDSPRATALEGVSGPGDSGGPAYLDGADGEVLVGVSSGQSSRATGGQPGRYGVTEYYTRVSRYVAWIEGVTGPLSRGP